MQENVRGVARVANSLEWIGPQDQEALELLDSQEQSLADLGRVGRRAVRELLEFERTVIASAKAVRNDPAFNRALLELRAELVAELRERIRPRRTTRQVDARVRYYVPDNGYEPQNHGYGA